MGDFIVRPIGVVRSALKDPADAPKQGALTGQEAEIVVDPAYLPRWTGSSGVLHRQGTPSSTTARIARTGGSS